MTWREFLAAIQAAGLTQKAFATATGTDAAVVNRWQHRVRGCPRWVGLWLEQHGGNGSGKKPAPKAADSSRTAKRRRTGSRTATA